MTPEKLKQLAEFAAEFLNLKPTENNRHWGIPENLYSVFGSYFMSGLELGKYFFADEITAPILAHLAKREMDKDKNLTYECGSAYVLGKLVKTCSIYQNIPDKEIRKADDNEFIALWSAIEATGEK